MSADNTLARHTRGMRATTGTVSKILSIYIGQAIVFVADPGVLK